jgi:hypothetical protein
VEPCARFDAPQGGRGESIAEQAHAQQTERHLGHRVEIWSKVMVVVEELETGQRTVADAQHCVYACTAESNKAGGATDDDVGDAKERAVGAGSGEVGERVGCG